MQKKKKRKLRFDWRKLEWENQTLKPHQNKKFFSECGNEKLILKASSSLLIVAFFIDDFLFSDSRTKILTLVIEKKTIENRIIVSIQTDKFSM